MTRSKTRVPSYSDCTVLLEAIALVKESLILFRILRKRGVPAELRIGVRKVDGTFNAHAWIECHGRILLGGSIAHLYTPLPLNT